MCRYRRPYGRRWHRPPAAITLDGVKLYTLVIGLVAMALVVGLFDVP
ncbi:MAG: hypothetical protein U0746_09540 [Gemmataceae bacterium]